MRVFRGTAHHFPGPCNVTIGNFDGLHLGHLMIISQLKETAAHNHLPTVVITFEPHPREYFSPHHAPVRLTTLREKLEYFQQLGVDYVVVMPFNHHTARISAQSFIDEILVRHLQTRTILIGDDFCFGHKRSGNVDTLRQAGKIYGFDVATQPSLMHGNKRISSTAIRQLLHEGLLKEAQALLGRPYSISGKVIQGDKLGRVLGYPTANIYLKHPIPPLMGIFCVEVHGLDKPYQGAASLGIRPTVKENAPAVLEVFILDFDRQIYQHHLRIDFLKKLRNEIKFPDVASLTEQMAHDVEDTKTFFRTR